MRFANLNYLGATYLTENEIQRVFFYKIDNTLIPISLNFIDFMKIFYIDAKCDLNSCLANIYCYDLNDVDDNDISVDNKIYMTKSFTNYSRPVENVCFFYYKKKRYLQMQKILSWQQSDDFNITISSVKKVHHFENVQLIVVENQFQHYVSVNSIEYNKNVYGLPRYETVTLLKYNPSLKQYVES